MSTRAEYRRLRAEHPTLGAASALGWARSIRPAEHDWSERRRGDGFEASFERDGFTVRLEAVYDWDADQSYLGELVEGRRDPYTGYERRPEGAFCKVRDERGDAYWYVPARWNDQGPEQLAAAWNRAGYSRGVAREMAEEACRQSARQLARGQNWILCARVFVDGHELGSDSLGGYDLAPDTDGAELERELEDGIRGNGLVEEALGQAEAELARLGELATQRASDAAEAAWRRMLPE